ncbi:MAG: 50S ribosomal protein L18 [Gemmatimonadales bacterium]|nr:MAG: 50S ribosomal protein L18 [Gemmatimonadales bacterium]
MRKSRRLQRERRHRRVRNKITGSAERPRLVVFRSLRNVEGQLVDDVAGVTLVGVSTLAPQLREIEPEGEHPQAARAHAAGKLLGERAREAGIETVVFDRGGYKYHGRVKAFAEGAREGGLRF